jgi:hypothetical protein
MRRRSNTAQLGDHRGLRAGPGRRSNHRSPSPNPSPVPSENADGHQPLACGCVPTPGVQGTELILTARHAASVPGGSHMWVARIITLPHLHSAPPPRSLALPANRSEDPASRSCFVYRHTNRRTEQHRGDALDPDLSGGHRAAKAKRGVHPSSRRTHLSPGEAARCPHLTAAWA